jgi:hypothetical protein
MPDFTRLRRLPVLLPPMSRTTESTTSSKKSSGQPKIIKQKSAIKIDKSFLKTDKEKDDISRYIIPIILFDYPTFFLESYDEHIMAPYQIFTRNFFPKNLILILIISKNQNIKPLISSVNDISLTKKKK